MDCGMSVLGLSGIDDIAVCDFHSCVLQTWIMYPFPYWTIVI